MWLYQRMARSQKNSEFRFMNYGFKDDDEIELSENDEPDRLFIQLYHMNIRLKSKEERYLRLAQEEEGELAGLLRPSSRNPSLLSTTLLKQLDCVRHGTMSKKI